MIHGDGYARVNHTRVSGEYYSYTAHNWYPFINTRFERNAYLKFPLYYFNLVSISQLKHTHHGFAGLSP